MLSLVQDVERPYAADATPSEWEDALGTSAGPAPAPAPRHGGVPAMPNRRASAPGSRLSLGVFQGSACSRDWRPSAAFAPDLFSHGQDDCVATIAGRMVAKHQGFELSNPGASPILCATWHDVIWVAACLDYMSICLITEVHV